MIAGSAVNQDGARSGLTAPNGPAQEAVIREALRRAGVAPAEVDYVEAHGTGTALGDPDRGAGARRGARRRRPADRPAVDRVGEDEHRPHEAAAGMAGLIKVVLALEHGEIPPQLHFERAESAHPLGRAAGARADGADALAGRSRRRVAGVSSFGFSGTNAHVIVDAAPRRREPTPSRPSGTAVHIC